MNVLTASKATAKPHPRYRRDKEALPAGGAFFVVCEVWAKSGFKHLASSTGTDRDEHQDEYEECEAGKRQDRKAPQHHAVANDK